MTLGMWDPDTATVAWLQGQLNSLGFGPVTVDGAYGPQTAAAVQAYQSANGLQATGIYDAATEAAFGQAAPATGTSAQDLIRATYPQIAWAYNIPEIKTIIDQAAAGHWDAARIQGAVEATGWWKSTSASQRTWAQQLAEDPATAAARKGQMSGSLADQAGQLGITLDSTLLDQLSEQALSMGMNAGQITDMLVAHQSGPLGPGVLSSTQNQLRGLASQYAVPVSDQTLSTWSAQIVGGSATQEGFLSYVTDQAKSMFPGLTAAIDAGISVRQYVEPAVQIAQRELGINPSTFDLLDPKWSKFVNQKNDQGIATPMSLDQWTSTLRSDPSYGFDSTTNGRSAAVDLASQIQKKFGQTG